MSASEAGPLEQRYFDRMASSIGDKARMLPHLVGDVVLDVGSGGGELALAAAATGRQVWALDLADDAIDRLQKLPELAGVVQGRADEVVTLLPDVQFDSILCSAVMHEVYSYSASTGETHFAALDHTMTSLVSKLTPGGRLIIRDGVMPPRPQEPSTLRVPDPAVVEQYLAITPHPELQLSWDGEVFHGTRHAVAEAMLTITWGVENFHREAWERFQLFTRAGYGQYGERFGLRLLDSSVVTQRGYKEALSAFQATTYGVAWFPPTNGLWVWQKR